MDRSDRHGVIQEPPWAIAELEPYRELFEEAPVAYLELDGAGIVRRVNRACCELLGYPAEEIVGKPIWTYALAEERDASRQAIARKLAREEPLVPYHRSVVARDQRAITVEVHCRLILDQEGRPIGIRAAVFDITEKVVAETRLKESQQWLTTTLDSLGEAVVAVDPLGMVKSINRCAQELLQLSAAEAVGRDVTDLFSEGEIMGVSEGGVWTLSNVLDRSLLHCFKGSMVLSGRHGKVTTVELSSSPILLEESRVAGTVIVLRAASPA